MLDFATATGSPDADAVIELIRSTWQQAGVELNVRRYPSALLFAPLDSGGVVLGGKWDAIFFNWGMDAIGDLSILYGCDAIPPKGQNDARYCDRAASAAMEKFTLEYDERKRQRYAALVQRAIARDVPIVVTSVNEDVYAFNADLTGFRPNQLSPFDDMLAVDI
ncbi:MAG: hypothetical protein NVSMB21_26300 [Vulcanimicrobiaceae bacterium]